MNAGQRPVRIRLDHPATISHAAENVASLGSARLLATVPIDLQFPAHRLLEAPALLLYLVGR